MKIKRSTIARAQLSAHNERYKQIFGRDYPTSNFVAGVGNPRARLVFIGEAPGEHEDRQGVPFVGPSGKLLDECLESIQIARDDIYITNLLKYRPPDNRDPHPQEILPMLTMLDFELNIVCPKMIVTLGRFSAMLFFPQPYMQSIAGRLHIKKGYPVLPMYHPAYILRNHRLKKEYISQFQIISQTLGEVSA